MVRDDSDGVEFSNVWYILLHGFETCDLFMVERFTLYMLLVDCDRLVCSAATYVSVSAHIQSPAVVGDAPSGEAAGIPAALIS